MDNKRVKIMKTISKFLLLTSILLLIGLGTISATDNITDTTQSQDIAPNKIITQDNVIQKTNNNMEKINQNKTIKKNEELTNNVKTGSTIKVTSTNYDQFFETKNGMTKSTDLIQSGDTINLQGTFKNVDFAVDKSITLTSQNKNAKLYNCTVYIQGTKSSKSTVSNLTIQNSKETTSGIHVNVSSQLTIKDNTVKVNGKNSFAFAADKMNRSTVKSNYFEALRPEGQQQAHTTMAIGSSYYNNIANNTVNCQANGIYLSIYGNSYAHFTGGASDYNNITGNKVTGANDVWCYSIQVMGKNNIISYNNVSGGLRGISTQDYMYNVISNNDVDAFGLGIYACEGATVTNNNVHVTGNANGITIGGTNVKLTSNTIKTVNGTAIEICGDNAQITKNTITSTDGYGIYSKGKYTNIIINSNKITTKKEGILFKKQSSSKKINNIYVNANTINSKAAYAINFEEAGAATASDVNVTVTESNVLTSQKGTGLTVAYLKPSNAKDNNEKDTNQKITVDQTNYDEWFDNGVANLKIKQNATVTLSGTFNDVDFTFNKKVHIIGKNCVINHGTIALTGDSHASTITGITIKNNNKNDINRHGIEILDVNNCKITNTKITNYASYESLGIFLYGAKANTISGCTVTTTGDYINNGILLYSSDSNTIQKNTIKITQSNKQTPYDESIMFNEKIGTIKEVLHTHGIIALYSSNNNINTNTITATSQFTVYTFPTSKCKNSIVGIDLYFDSNNNKVTKNNITIKSYGPFVYGMGVLGGYWGSSITSLNATGNTFENNNVKVNGGYFATGFIAGRNSVATTVKSNTFNIYIYANSTKHGDYAHGVTLENSTQSTVSNNKIQVSGSAAYPVELFDSSNNKIMANTITATATNPYGIAGYRTSNNNITENTITLKKVNYGKTDSAAHSDVIPVGDEAIMLMYTSKNNNITANAINTNATYTVKLTDQTTKNTVTGNSLKAKSLKADKSVLDEGTSNKVSNNFLYFVNATLSPVNAKIGDTITINATVTTQATNTKNLKATFKIGTKTIGTSTVSNGKAKISYNISTLEKPTTYTLTVSLKGTNFQNATATAKATFTKNPEKTVVKVAKVLQTIGNDAKLTANITTQNGGKISSGKADFYLDDVYLFTRNVKLGKASGTYKIASDAKSKVHTIKVVYKGTVDYATSSGTNKLGVQTKSTFTVSSYTSTLKDVVTINATIKSGGKAIKSGKVQIYINDKQICNTNIKNGVVTYKYKVPTTFDKGTYTVKFVYGGNNTQSAVTKTSKIKIYPFKPVFDYTTTKAKVGQSVSLVLKVSNGKTNADKYNAMDGNVTVKLNGKTLTNSKGNAIVGTIKNGKLTFKFTAPEQLAGYQNLTFVYTGYSKFAAGSKTYKNGLLIV